MEKSYFKDKILFIAEIGKNFIDEESLDSRSAFLRAKQLITSAKDSGANVVKFQTHVFEDEYKKRGRVRYDWIKSNEIITPFEGFWKPLKGYCDKLGILFMTTPMSKMAAEKVNDLVEVWKIGSGDIVDFELLEYVKSTDKPVIISTGMSTEEQISTAVKFLEERDLAIMHCVSIYPCPLNKLNLNTISYFKTKYDLPVGFSDHSLSTKIALNALEQGATIIEKHFTDNRKAYGPDHKCSLYPDEFAEMVKNTEDYIINTYGYGTYGVVLNDEEKEHWRDFRI